jgi:hypothetical protein
MQNGCWNLGLTVASLSIAGLIVAHRPAYLQRRTAWLVLVKLLGILALTAPVRQQATLLPWELAPEGGPPTSRPLRLVVAGEEVRAACWP